MQKIDGERLCALNFTDPIKFLLIPVECRKLKVKVAVFFVKCVLQISTLIKFLIKSKRKKERLKVFHPPLPIMFYVLHRKFSPETSTYAKSLKTE